MKGETNQNSLSSVNGLLTVAAVGLIFLTGCDKLRCADAADIVLSPGGPISTPAAAVARARELRHSGAVRGRAVTVSVHPGRYRLSEPIMLGPEDSGLHFVGCGFDQVVFSGGRMLGDFRDTGKGWWEADAAGLADIQQLTVNGRFAVPATSPNEGYFYIKDAPDRSRVTFMADPADVAPLMKMSSDELARVRVPLYQSWDMGISVLKLFDAGRCALTVSPGCSRPILFWNKFCPRYKLQNFRAALDAPGEWFQEGRTVLYVPRSGEKAESSFAVAPVLDALLDLSGVTNALFRGIAFEQARLQIGGKGFGNDDQAQVQLPAAVETHDSSNIVFDRCRFSQLAPHALWFARGTDDSRVTNCLFEDLGAGGIYVGSTQYDVTNMLAYANRILLRDNIIREGGRIADGAHGVWLGHTTDVTIEHNEIADFHYTGIASGWLWGYEPTPTRRIRIAWNHVHHIGNGILSDMAAIYTIGEHAGSEIIGNRIHDVWCYGQAGRGGRGIYTDEGSAHILIASNLVYNVSSGQITQHYGKDNRFVNNIFAFSRGTGEMIYHARVENHHSFDFDHNIVVWEGAREAVHSWDGYSAEKALSDVTYDHNLWWRYDGDAAADEFNHVDYAAWRKLGADPHGVIADPKFRNATGLDFDLAVDSPALALGFVPWNWRAAGVTGEQAWRDLADKKYYDPPKVPVAPLYLPKEQRRQIAATLHVAGHEFGGRDQELPLAKSAGIGMVRGGIYLQQIVRADGTFDFSRSDAALAACEKAGVEWLPILFSAKTSPFVWEDMTLWRKYVRALVSRYRGRVGAWEVWNEQNLRQFWGDEPNPTNYVKVLRAAYEEVKAADPAAKVVIGGYSGVPCDAIEEAYRCGAKDFFDIMNVHPYVYPGAPEGQLDGLMERLRDLMKRYGDGKKPVWFTEIGWPTHKLRLRSIDVLVRALKMVDPAKGNWKIVYTDEETNGAWSELVRPFFPGATLEEIPMSRFRTWLTKNSPDVVVFAHSGVYDQTVLSIVKDRVLSHGGVLACLSGVPLLTSCTSDAGGGVCIDRENAGFADRPKLGIRMRSEHTDRRIPKDVLLENGKTAQRFFAASSDPGVSFEPLSRYRAKTNGLDLVAAGLYRYEGGRKGTIVVSGLMEKSSRTSSEAQQACLLPRAIARALQLGVEKYFIYEFKSMEKDEHDPESHFGIVRRNFSPKPAYEALKTFHSFRPDGSRQSQDWAPIQSGDGACACQWIRPDGKIAGMLWRPSGRALLRLKFLTDAVCFYSADGRPMEVKADANGRVSLALDKDVVYYVGANFTGVW